MSAPVEPTREVGIGIAATVLALACLVVTVLTITAGGWWLLLLLATIPIGVPSAYGAVTSFRALPRDDQGNPVHR